MAILRVKEIGERGGVLTDRWDREYDRTFQVITSGPLVGSLEVELANGIPRVGDPYVYGAWVDFAARVRKVVPTQPDKDAPDIWHVKVNWSTQQQQDPSRTGGGSGGSPQNDNPISWTPDVSVDWVDAKKVVDKDLDGRPCVNTIGERLDPGLEIESPRLVVTITRNEAGYGLSEELDRGATVNEFSFWGRDPGTWKLHPVAGKLTFEKNVSFWKKTYKLEFKPDGWQPKVANIGTFSKKDDGTYETKVVPVDNAGIPTGEKVRLDARGVALAPTADTHMLDFTGYYTYDFNQFGFPTWD
jgi:hypothetical protein